ncbi:hypothetical protein ACFELO_01705 [Oceanicaulis sp. LC35]|uniref:hypothetical protein n=1 Tax=Oceanicaulis sp. LC35 TaxID=3349635 RepID=UPI003F874A42
MNLLTALAPLIGALAALSALWVDHVVTRRQTGAASRISLGVSAMSGLACALALFLANGDWVQTSAALAAGTALCVAVSLDLRLGLLADLTSLILAVAAFSLAPVLTPGLSLVEMVISAALAAGILGLAGLYGRLRRGQMGLGGGDIVLAGALGLWCAPVTAALGVALGAGLTLLVALLRAADGQSRLPFGPGLAAGFLLALGLQRVL